jgi:hypothetical protein
MISTALALQEVTKQADHDNMVMDMAAAIYQNKDSMTNDEFAKALYQYSALLSSLTTTLATSVLLTESQLDEMINTIKEMESMGKDVE